MIITPEVLTVVITKNTQVEWKFIIAHRKVLYILQKISNFSILPRKINIITQKRFSLS